MAFATNHFPILIFSCVCAQFACESVTPEQYSIDLGNTIVINGPKKLGEEITAIKVSLKEAKSICHVKKKYTFFQPEVHLDCDCTCVPSFEQTCTTERRVKNACPTLRNATTTCTLLEVQGFVHTLCPKNYLMCCEAYFSKANSDTYYTLKETSQTTMYKMEFVISSSQHDKRIEIDITQEDSVKRILLDDNIFMEWTSVPRHLAFDLRHWYVRSQKDEDQLIYSENLNEADEYDLQKLGWFRTWNGGDKLVGVRRLSLENCIKISATNCIGESSVPTWDLDVASVFDNLNTPKYNSGFSVKYIKENESLLMTFEKASISFSLTTNHSIIERHVTFQSCIQNMGSQSSLLTLATVGNDGHYHVTIKDYLGFSDSKRITVTNAASKNSNYNSWIFSHRFFRPIWVCVKNEQQKNDGLCQMSRLSNDCLGLNRNQFPLSNTTIIIATSSDLRHKNESLVDLKDFRNQTEGSGFWKIEYLISATTVPVIFFVTVFIIIIIIVSKNYKKMIRYLIGILNDLLENNSHNNRSNDDTIPMMQVLPTPPADETEIPLQLTESDQLRIGTEDK